MTSLSRAFTSAAALFAFCAFTPLPASAALIVDGSLTLDTEPALIYQQTAASPCVIGGENCLNGGFPYTVAGSGGGGTLFDETSPNYTYAQITGLTGSSSFTIGLDYNDTSQDQRLDYFAAFYSGGTSQIFDIPTDLKTNNNGVGYSDFLLTGFVIPVGESVTFQAIWLNNDGPDRYFIIGAQAPVCDPAVEDCDVTVPEPASMALFGMAALAAGLVRRRTAKK